MSYGTPSPTPSPTPVPVRANAVIVTALKFYRAAVAAAGDALTTEQAQAYNKALKHAEGLPDDLAPGK